MNREDRQSKADEIALYPVGVAETKFSEMKNGQKVSFTESEAQEYYARWLKQISISKNTLGDDRFQQKELLDCLPPETKIDTPRLSKILNGKAPWISLGEDNFFRVLFYMNRCGADIASGQRAKIRKVEDHMYFSMAEEYGQWIRTEDQLKSGLPGVYVSYRPSLGAKGYIAVGLFLIFVSPITEAVIAQEHIFVRERKQLHDTRERHIRFDGYAIRVRHTHIFYMTDGARDLPRVSYLHMVAGGAAELEKTAVYGDVPHKVLSLDGVSCGMYANKEYAAKHHLERLSSWDALSLHPAFQTKEAVSAGLNKYGLTHQECIGSEKVFSEEHINCVVQAFREYKVPRERIPEASGDIFALDVLPIDLIPPNARFHLERSGDPIKLF